MCECIETWQRGGQLVSQIQQHVKHTIAAAAAAIIIITTNIIIIIVITLGNVLFTVWNWYDLSLY